MTFSEYLEVDAVSNTALGWLHKSPATYRWHKDNPDSMDTEALRVGRYFHTLVLEPERANMDYVLTGDYNMASKEGLGRYLVDNHGEPEGIIDLKMGDLRDCLKAHESEDRRTKINAKQAEFVPEMADALRSHPEFQKLFDGTETERTVTANDGRFDVKARLDGIRENIRAVVDLKTCAAGKAHPDKWPAHCWNYGYHRQAAWYLRTAKLAGIDVDTFVFAVVEKSPPYHVLLYACSADLIDQGNREIDGLLDLLDECHERGEWPGYQTDPDSDRFNQPGITNFDLPAWAVDNQNKETT